MSASGAPQEKPETELDDALQQYPFPDYDAHIKNGKVSFTEVVQAFFDSRNTQLDEVYPQGYRYKVAQYYERLRASFEQAPGIKEIYWGSIQTRCASVLTADDNIFDVAPGPEEETLELYQVMWDCEELVIEVRGNLKGTPRAVAMKRLFEIITNAMDELGKLRRQAGGVPQAGPHTKPSPPPPGATVRSVPPSLPTPTGPAPAGEISQAVIGFFEKQVDAVKSYYRKMATRAGLSYYLTGAAAGVALVGVLVALLLVSRSSITSSGTSVDALAAFIAGAAGGAVGVMTRLLDKDLSVDYDAGRVQILLGGFFRPIVGSVLGSAFFAAVFSGIIPLTVPSDSTKALAFYAFVAFIGGLAERWAQDTLVQSGEGIFGTAGKKGAEKGGKSTSQLTPPT